MTCESPVRQKDSLTRVGRDVQPGRASHTKFFFLRADPTRLFTIKDCSTLNKHTLWKEAKYPQTEQIQNHDSTNTLPGWLSSLEWKAPLILKQSSSYYSHNLYKNDPLLRIDSSKDCLISALSYRWTC